jgi:hypothetical protein
LARLVSFLPFLKLREFTLVMIVTGPSESCLSLVHGV